jgi:cyclic lactone autoinducer peptide
MKRLFAKGILATLALLIPIVLSQACWIGFYQAETPQKPQN